MYALLSHSFAVPLLLFVLCVSSARAVAEGPDLSVGRVSVGPSAFERGDRLRVRVTVRNDGDRDVPPGTWIGAGLWSGGRKLGWVGTYAAVPAGGSVVLRGDQAVSAPERSFRLRIVADDLDQVRETDEGDNVRSGRVTSKKKGPGAAAVPATPSPVSPPPAPTVPSVTPAPSRGVPAPAGQDSSRWSLLFGDSFAGASADTRAWRFCYYWAEDGCTNGGNNELQWYQKDGVTVSDGTAKLTARRRNAGGLGYTSGMLSTAGKFSFLYGYAEARMKLPKGRGLWPGFWLLPHDRSWPPEIDVMEYLGGEPTRVYMTYHFVRDGNRYLSHSYSGPDFSAGFHTFGVRWSPGLLVWYVDGVERHRSDSPDVPSKAMDLVVALAVGGWTGGPDAATVFPAVTEVDHVAVWKTPETRR